MLVLQIVQGPDRGKRFELPEREPQLIGRSSEALPLTDNTVSRRHAELTPDDGAWFLRDLDSANGTFLNGQRITDRIRLSPGDQVRCGSTLFIFRVGADGDRRTSMVKLMDPELLDVTVERTADANAESMILASPDPVRAATDHLRVIYELTALTASTFNEKELLTKVMELIFDEFKPDRGFLLLGDDASGPLDAAVTRYRVRPRTIDEGRIPISRTIIQHTFEKGRGILSTNALADTRFRAGDSVRDYGIRSAICVPITAGERVFGVIQIDSQIANFTFTENQLQLLNAIGQHTGLALLSAELVQTRVQTERLAAIGQTVASLSHSIKNILQGLRGGIDAVELALRKNDHQLAQEGWPIVTRNLDRILNLTLNMLAYSRQSNLEIELVDLNGLVTEVSQMLAHECDRRQIGLLHDLAEDLPPVPLDVSGIHQCLMNLLLNSLEAAPPKKGVVTVKTAYRPDAHEVRVNISDNGPGIDPARLPLVFDAFTSTKGQRGTGLGLAVTRKIVEEHGGHVTIESSPGRGTTATISLPSDRPGLDAADTHLPRPIHEDDL